MCVSTDNVTCVLTGLPLVKHNKHGRFCSSNCGLVEAIVRDELAQSVADSKALKWTFNLDDVVYEHATGDSTDTTPAVSAAADKFIKKTHEWIQTVISSLDNQ